VLLRRGSGAAAAAPGGRPAQDYDDTALVSILRKMAAVDHEPLDLDTAVTAVRVLARERALPNFGNAGAVRNLLDQARARPAALPSCRPVALPPCRPAALPPCRAAKTHLPRAAPFSCSSPHVYDFERLCMTEYASGHARPCSVRTPTTLCRSPAQAKLSRDDRVAVDPASAHALQPADFKANVKPARPPVEIFAELVGGESDDVRKLLEKIDDLVLTAEAKGQDKRQKMPYSIAFLGNPGTGARRATAARRYRGRSRAPRCRLHAPAPRPRARGAAAACRRKINPSRWMTLPCPAPAPAAARAAAQGRPRWRGSWGSCTSTTACWRRARSSRYPCPT
jgi:hypothetical protein